ncbi:alpha-L-fucosidase [soil metagenome]
MNREIAAGPFQPTWESLKQSQSPDWFRDAKFGIWAHWSAQCVPEQGDWYGRHMYMQGHPHHAYHCKTYGHPSKVGFMEIENLWKAENWNPDELIDLYVKAGAKYFVALANHHDNFDCYDSTHHAWNSIHYGPKKDIVGIWREVTLKRGLKFGVSNHAAHAWHWYQPAYGYDPEGEFAGVRYDAHRLKKEDGAGKWWAGLDPQDLYTGPHMVMPDGIKTIAEARAWHDAKDGQWLEDAPANSGLQENWFLRTRDLLDRYMPDFMYLDDTELPMGQAGLDIAAHYYNSSVRDHGALRAVLTAKKPQPEHAGAFTLDIEWGGSRILQPRPWQLCSCIGEWHYKRDINYASATWVIRTLADTVAKNGNLLLSIPMRGDGTIDDRERSILADLTAWIEQHGEAIYNTRPYRVFGEGTEPSKDANGNTPFFLDDHIRYTTNDHFIYAILFAWPTTGKLTLKSLANSPANESRRVTRVEMLSAGTAPLEFTHDPGGLSVTLPERRPHELAWVLKIACQ